MKTTDNFGLDAEEAKLRTTFVCDRVAARSTSMRWLTENKEMNEAEAIALVEQVEKRLEDWEIGFMLAIVRWAYYKTIDPENEADIKRVKDLLEAFIHHLMDHDNQSGVRIEFANLCFKFVREGEKEKILWTMKETEYMLRPWMKKAT